MLSGLRPTGFWLVDNDIDIKRRVNIPSALGIPLHLTYASKWACCILLVQMAYYNYYWHTIATTGIQYDTTDTTGILHATIRVCHFGIYVSQGKGKQTTCRKNLFRGGDGCTPCLLSFFCIVFGNSPSVRGEGGNPLYRFLKTVFLGRKTQFFGKIFSDFRPFREGRGTLFSDKKCPLNFWENLIREGPGGPT